MPDFLDVNITVDPAELTDTAIDAYTQTLQNNGYPGYVANDAALEIILFGVIMGLFADLASTAAQVPAAILRKFGTDLLKLTYGQGASATLTTTWTLTDTDGHTIPGGTYVTVSNIGFYVAGDVVVAMGDSTASVLLIASDPGTASNGLTDPVETVDQIDWVVSIVAVGSSSGGADPQDDSSFQDEVVAEFALQAPRPITADNYAAFAQVVPSTILPSGVVVGRTTAIDGYDPSIHTFTGNTTNTSPNVASVSSFTGVTAGTQLSGTGIPAGTTVLSINTGASTLVMSKNATATNSGVTITATGSYGNERTVTVFVTDPAGISLSSPAMSAIQAWLASYRELNFVIYVLAPTTTTIYVTFEVHVLPGYDPSGTVANAELAVANYLNPATWGSNPNTAQSGFLNSIDGFNLVRLNKLIGIVESTPGVDYVPSGGLTLGTTASPVGTSDITLNGPAPLVTSNLSVPTIVGSSV